MKKIRQIEPLTPNMELFCALSDEVRLKIMMILDRAEFTVNELKDILGIHQSNTSRHLAKLSACKLLRDRRESTRAYYGLSDSLYMSPSLLETIRKASEALPDKEIIQSGIQRILEKRRSTNARKFHKLDETGGSLNAQIGLFSSLLSPFSHAIDIGCGDSAPLSILLSRRAKKVTAVDIQKGVIQELSQTLRDRAIENVAPLEADMANIPLESASADLVLMSQVLHHAPSPALALQEAVRLLAPGGTLAILDLAAHNEEELRETHGHIWLGFDQTRIEFFLRDLPCKILSAEIIQSEAPAMKHLPSICIIAEKL